MAQDERNGLVLQHVNGSTRFYYNDSNGRTIMLHYHACRDVPKGTCNAILKAAGFSKMNSPPLKYSLVIERTSDPCFFGYYSPDLPGFTGTASSVEECVEVARRERKIISASCENAGRNHPPRTLMPAFV